MGDAYLNVVYHIEPTPAIITSIEPPRAARNQPPPSPRVVTRIPG